MKFLAPTLIALTLAVPAAAAAGQKATETVDRTVAIGINGTLKLSNFSGDVRISGTNGTEVVIHAVRRATRERLDRIKLDIQSTRSGVSIEANRRDPDWKDRDNNVVETEFDIKVPYGTELDLNSFSGRLEVTGVSGRIDAHTFSGNIELDVTRADKLPAMSAQTFSGDIRARVPASASGRVEFNSFSGDLDSDIPIAMRSSRRRDVSGDIGGGEGPTLKFKTFSGDLQIRR